MASNCPACGEALDPRIQQPRTINCRRCNKLWRKDWDPAAGQNIPDENGQALWLDIKPVWNTGHDKTVPNAGGEE